MFCRKNNKFFVIELCVFLCVLFLNDFSIINENDIIDLNNCFNYSHLNFLFITMILVNHNIVPCLDSKHPCSLSEAWHKKLRSLNFSGLILTDDLAMGAIKNYTGEYPVSILAVLAENNYILTSSFEEHFNEVLNATKKGILAFKTLLHLSIKLFASFLIWFCNLELTFLFK